MKGAEAIGHIAQIDPETWEIVATGFRNQYDAAFNREGELPMMQTWSGISVSLVQHGSID